MWNILNILVNSKVYNFYPEEFIHNKNIFNTPMDIANGFNDWFVSVYVLF